MQEISVGCDQNIYLCVVIGVRSILLNSALGIHKGMVGSVECLVQTPRNARCHDNASHFHNDFVIFILSTFVRLGDTLGTVWRHTVHCATKTTIAKETSSQSYIISSKSEIDLWGCWEKKTRNANKDNTSQREHGNHHSALIITQTSKTMIH